MHLIADRLADFFDNFAAMPIRLGTAMGKDSMHISLPTSQPTNGAGQ
jgi:hypothetical protein